MAVWRLVREKMATLTEIETSWSYDDIMRALAVLDYESDLAYLASKRKDKQK